MKIFTVLHALLVIPGCFNIQPALAHCLITRHGKAAFVEACRLLTNRLIHRIDNHMEGEFRHFARVVLRGEHVELFAVVILILIILSVESLVGIRTSRRGRVGVEGRIRLIILSVKVGKVDDVILNDSESQRQANLRGCQANSRSFQHRLAHRLDELGQSFAGQLAGVLLPFGAQNGLSQAHDRQQSVWETLEHALHLVVELLINRA